MLVRVRDLRAVTAVTALGAVTAVLGLPLGLLWSWLAPDVPVRVTSTGGAAFATTQPEQPAAADAWFALLGLGFGALVAVCAWRLAAGTRGPAGLLALVAGTAGAGLLAWWVGRQVGLAGYQAALESAPPGAVLDRPADLRIARTGWWPPVVTGVVLAPALSAAVTYTLVAAWSRFPSLGVPPPGPSDREDDRAPTLDGC